MTSSGYMSLPEVVERLGLDQHMKNPVRWLSEQIHRGRIPGRKIGHRLCMSEADIAAAEEAWLVGSPRQTVPGAAGGLSTASARRRLRSAS